MSGVQLYNTSSDVVITGPLIAINACCNLAAAVSALLNLLLIWVTLRSSQLRSTCNRMLAMLALSDFLFDFNGWVSLVLMVAGIQEGIPIFTCYLLQFLPLFGLETTSLLILLISLDRLISVECAW